MFSAMGEYGPRATTTFKHAVNYKKPSVEVVWVIWHGD